MCRVCFAIKLGRLVPVRAAWLSTAWAAEPSVQWCHGGLFRSQTFRTGAPARGQPACESARQPLAADDPSPGPILLPAEKGDRVAVSLPETSRALAGSGATVGGRTRPYSMEASRGLWHLLLPQPFPAAPFPDFLPRHPLLHPKTSACLSLSPQLPSGGTEVC